MVTLQMGLLHLGLSLKPWVTSIKTQRFMTEQKKVVWSLSVLDMLLSMGSLICLMLWYANSLHSSSLDTAECCWERVSGNGRW